MVSRRPFRRRLRTLLALGATLLLAACIHTFVRPDVVEVEAPTIVRTPLRVHLMDGSTVLFRTGGYISATSISGIGTRYPLLATTGTEVSGIAMDSVVGVEAFQDRTDLLGSLIVSAAATAVGGALTVAAAVAIFGSCPTVYTDVGQGLELQAEGFSYAISPLMEHRDLDPLRLVPDADGVLRLELRNEALETHYLNHVELLAVRHAPGTTVVSDQSGQPVQVSGFTPLLRATDRAGRDVLGALRAADQDLFSTASSTVATAEEGDLDDWIDIEADGLSAGDSMAVVLRLRNSLLNTVLLYEGMLGGRDAPDFLAQDLEHIAQTVDMGRWYVRTLGLRATVEGVPVPEGEAYDGHARLGDVGPVAFRDVAIVLPRPSTPGPVRVRLRFVADNWRIDQARIAGVVQRPTVQTLPVERVVVPVPAQGDGPVLDAPALRGIAAADDQYLETRPGQRMLLEFTPLPDASGEPTTYLIGWQGWYREWIRPSWLARPTRTSPFVPGDAAVITALRSWESQKDAFERAFYSSTIPVR